MKPRPPTTVSGAAVSAADLAAWIHADAHELAQDGAGIAAAEAVPAPLFAFIRHIDSFTAAVTQAVHSVATPTRSRR